MIIVRPASIADKSEISCTLKEADLHYLGEKLDHFLVAEKDGKIAGIVRLEEHAAFFFLSSLGVKLNFRQQGVATALLNHVSSNSRKPIYLYTIIPRFFEKFGFHPTPAPPSLPPKELFGCDQCRPEFCFVMVKGPHGT